MELETANGNGNGNGNGGGFMSATSAGAGGGANEIMPDRYMGADGEGMSLQPPKEDGQGQGEGILQKVASGAKIGLEAVLSLGQTASVAAIEKKGGVDGEIIAPKTAISTNLPLNGSPTEQSIPSGSIEVRDGHGGVVPVFSPSVEEAAASGEGLMMLPGAASSSSSAAPAPAPASLAQQQAPRAFGGAAKRGNANANHA